MILKHFQTRKPQLKTTPSKTVMKEEEKNQSKSKTKTGKKNENKDLITETVTMTTAEKIEMAQSILSTPSVKKIKKDNSLIERAESNKSIITEDNKELLVD